MRKLNLPWVAGIVFFPFVFGASIYFLHSFQMKRNAAVFKREAKRAQKEGKTEEALLNLRRYIKLAPNDAEGLILYGTQLADLSSSQPSYVQPAYLVLEEALRKLPSDSEAEKLGLRKRLLELTVKMGRYLDAMDLLENFLLKESPKDSNYLEQLARCQVSNKEPQKAEASFKSAIEQSPDQVMTYLRLAILISSNEDRINEANELVDQMVDRNPENPVAYLARSEWRNRQMSLSRSLRPPNPSLTAELSASVLSDLKQALERSPENPDDLVMGARLSVASGNKEEAREFIRIGIEKAPANTQFYKALAELETSSGNDAASIDALQRGIAACSDDLEKISPIERDKILELKWILANRMIDMNDLARAKEAINQLREAKYYEPLVTYLDARIPFRSSDWAAAIVKMEALRPRLADRPQLIRQVYYWLGIAYRETNSPEQSLSMFRRAASDDRDWPQAQLALAESLVAANLLTDAVDEFRQICAAPDAPASVLIGFEKALLDLNKSKTPRLRNWNEFDAILKRLGQTDFDPSVIDLLRADRLLAEGDREGANRLMESAREKNPNQQKFLSAQIDLAQFGRDWDRVETLIQEAEKQFGDSVTLRRLKGRLIAQRNSADEARVLLKPLSEAPADWKESDRADLAFEFALLSFAVGDYDRAEELTMLSKAGSPKSLRIQLLLLDIATRGKKQSLVQQVLDEIRSETNEGAIWHYAEARRLVLLGSETKAKDSAQMKLYFDEAKSHLEQAAESRKSWDRIYTLWAEINELEGNFASATDQYLNAIRRGEKSPAVTGRALSLLFEAGDYVEANSLILTLRETQCPFTLGMLQIEVDIMLKQELYDQATMAVDKLIKDRQGKIDPIWMGRTYATLNKLDLAEKSFRSAIEENNKATVPWVSLVQVLLRSKQTEKAEIAIEEAKASMEGEYALVAVGQCYELAGNFALASESYQQAMKESPKNKAIQRQWIEFLFRTNSVPQAEQALREILSQSDSTELSKDERDNRRWAQLRLVDVLRVQPKAEKLDEALKLVDDQIKQSDTKSTEQLRKRAQILAMYPDREKRNEAIAILERLVEKEPSVNIQIEERWLLASLYQRAGNSEKSRDELRTIVIAKKDDLRALTGYILLSLQANELSEAELYLNSLKKYAPKDFTSVDVEIQVLFKRRNFAEIEKLFKLINSRVQSGGDIEEISRRQLAIARLYTVTASRFVEIDRLQDLKQYVSIEAESFFKSLIEEKPALIPLHAEFLAATHEIDRSLDLMQMHAADVAFPVLERTSRLIMKNRYATSEQLARLQELMKALKVLPNELVPLTLLRADLLSWRGEANAAADVFRELLRGDSKNVVALNNLAVVLALFGGDNAEALRLINKAIEIGGPLDSLYDTRGMVYLASGKLEAAIEDFERALLENDNAERRFHAAAAYARLSAGDPATADKNLKAAKKSLARADDFGLNDMEFHPIERQSLSKLRVQLGMPEATK